MTSQTPIGPEQHDLDRRTVRDIVEYSPAQVNEVWCRKIFRRILQSLELQYGMHMPHRAITPDTVVFHDNGDPLLIPSDLHAPPHGDGSGDPLRDDLTALAGVIHYAITGELIPEGPLHGRGFSGYSDALLGAVDRCMAPDPAQRPRTIDEVRAILGIVQPALAAVAPPVPEELLDDIQPVAAVPPAPPVTPAAPAPEPAVVPEPAPAPASIPMRETSAMPAAAAVPRAKPAQGSGERPDVPSASSVPATPSAPRPAAPGLSAPAPAPAPVPSFARTPGTQRFGAGLSPKRRWAIAAGGGALLAAFALFMFAQLRATGSYDDVALSLPQRADAPAGSAAQPPAAVPPAPAATSALPAAVGGAPTGTPTGAVPGGPATGAPVANPDAVTAAGVPNGSSDGSAVPPGGATYRLQIQPWGVVYVDGVDRGVSPPVKRLALAPGRHTVRVSNPNFQDRTLDIDTAAGDGRIVVDFGKDAVGTPAATAQ